MKNDTNDRYVIKRKSFFLVQPSGASVESYFAGDDSKTFDWDGCGVGREDAAELTLSDADALVARLNSCPYELKPWEYARPKYTIVLASTSSAPAKQEVLLERLDDEIVLESPSWGLYEDNAGGLTLIVGGSDDDEIIAFVANLRPHEAAACVCQLRDGGYLFLPEESVKSLADERGISISAARKYLKAELEAFCAPGGTRLLISSGQTSADVIGSASEEFFHHLVQMGAAEPEPIDDDYDDYTPQHYRFL